MTSHATQIAELKIQLDAIMNSNQCYKFQFLKKAELILIDMVDLFNEREIEDCEVSTYFHRVIKPLSVGPNV